MSETPFTVLTLQGGGCSIRVTDLGATWMSCLVPLRDGTRREVLLGYDDPAEHRRQRGSIGVTVGRYANRIAGARYEREGRTVQLLPNEGPNQLHGGPEGFDKRRWEIAESSAAHVRFTLCSPDGDQGFPGEVRASASYRVDARGVTLEYEATTTRTTPIALTNHAYFNLDAAHTDCRNHRLRLRAERYVPVDEPKIPLGPLALVDGTDFDFRDGHRIAERFLGSEQQRQLGGYDHAFLIDPACRDGSVPAAELESSDGRLAARLFTDRGAVQFYSGHKLNTTQRRGGGSYGAYDGLALEPGVPPDSPNRPEWGLWSDCFVDPGTTWRAWLRWEFEAR